MLTDEIYRVALWCAICFTTASGLLAFIALWFNKLWDNEVAAKLTITNIIFALTSIVVTAILKWLRTASVVSAVVIGGCVKPDESFTPIIDFETLGGEIVTDEERPDEPNIVNIDDLELDEPSSPGDALLDPDAPVGAHVPIGPGTDTTSVSDDQGRLPGDAGFEAPEPDEPETPALVEPTQIDFVSNRNCPTCILLRNDRAPQAIKRRFPNALVRVVAPIPNEKFPTLRIYAGETWRSATWFYPVAETHPTPSDRIAEMMRITDQLLTTKKDEK